MVGQFIGKPGRSINILIFSYMNITFKPFQPTFIDYIRRPPTFLLFCNVDALPTSYMRFLTRNFQETFSMVRNPVV